MGEKTAGVGHFTIPTAPSAGVSCTSGAANVFTTTYVQLIASTAAPLFITGIYVEEAAASAATYIVVQLATGAAAAESVVGQYLIPPSTGSTVTRSYRPIYPPIPVANATRIACKTADSVGAAAKLITLECIAQSNVVDDGVAVGTVTTLTNLPPITANWLTAAGISADAITAAKIADGAIDAATFAAGAINAAAIGADAITAAKIADGAIDAATFAAGAINAAAIAADAITDAKVAADVTIASVSGAVGSVTAAVTVGTINANAVNASALAADAVTEIQAGLALSTQVDALEGDTTTLLGRLTAGRAANLDFLDVSVASRLPTVGYTVPPTTALIADKILGRNLAGGVDGTRTVADALRALRNKTSLAGGVLTVCQEDDVTPAWTAAVTQAARDPITAVDPT